jgi:hypothetical protein
MRHAVERRARAPFARQRRLRSLARLGERRIGADTRYMRVDARLPGARCARAAPALTSTGESSPLRIRQAAKLCAPRVRGCAAIAAGLYSGPRGLTRTAALLLLVLLSPPVGARRGLEVRLCDTRSTQPMAAAARAPRRRVQRGAGGIRVRSGAARDARRGKPLVRLALPLNTARPVLYYNRDAFRRAKLNPRKVAEDLVRDGGVLGRSWPSRASRARTPRRGRPG